MKREFDHCADDYARYRPRYPEAVYQELIEQCGAAQGRLAVDCGAGTGIFAYGLHAAGWRVIALDSTLSMLRRIDATRARRVLAAAEQTGLKTASADLATAAQAFHWFNPRHALIEFARVLKPGGWLALCWNNRVLAGSTFLLEYERLIRKYNPAYRREYRQQDWPAKIATSGGFEAPRHRQFDHTWRPSGTEWIGYSRSVSYIRNVLSHGQRRRFEDELGDMIRASFGDENCCIPLVTELWTARRLEYGKKSNTTHDITPVARATALP